MRELCETSHSINKSNSEAYYSESDNKATEQPATEQPATEQPATEQPATEQRATEQRAICQFNMMAERDSVSASIFHAKLPLYMVEDWGYKTENRPASYKKA